MTTAIFTRTTLLAFALLTLPAMATAQPSPIPHRKEPYALASGVHQGLGAESTAAFRQVVRIPGAPWLQLHFAEYDLGAKSAVTITSLKDGHSQRLDAKSLPEWNDSTAYFNGDAVEVELHVAPGEQNIFIRMGELTVGEVPVAGPRPETICGGTDDRVASTDPRVGRIVPIGCTGWIVSNGAHLTAGHCTGAAMQILQFNVPASQANGAIVAPPPQDQYPINAASVMFANNGQGDDWAVFNTNRNATTGRLPVETQGNYFDMSRDITTATTIRITGYGVDGPGPSAACPTCDFGNTGPRDSTSQTQQTHAAVGQGETVVNANNVRWAYQTDTQPANSGSPIFLEGTGIALGIHTAGNCTASGGSNVGTGFEHDGLENAINAFVGANARYVDGGRIIEEDGTAYRPFSTVTEGVNSVPTGGIVSIVRGTYSETITITRAMRLIAPVGPARIGP
jgi:V8-like Glu-specific endopeptidase